MVLRGRFAARGGRGGATRLGCMTTPPAAKKIASARTFHGDTFLDSYEWMRDKTDPEVISYLEAQNAYADEVLADQEELREQIVEEIKSRTKETDSSAPTRKNGWWYFTRTYEGKNYPSLHRVPDRGERPDPEGELEGEQLVFDCNELAQGEEFFSLGGQEISPDGKLVAYAVDTAGDERFTIRIQDIASGEVLDESVTGAGYGLEWAADSATIAYGRVDDAWRAYQVWLHEVGSDPENDRLVFEEEDPRFTLNLGSSLDGKWLQLLSASTTSAEVRLLASDLSGEPVLVAARQPDLEYTVEPASDIQVIVHNRTKKDFEVAVSPVGEAAPETWQTIFAAGEGERIEGAAAFSSCLIVSMRTGALARLVLIPRTADGFGEARQLPAPDLAGMRLGSNGDYDAPFIDYLIESLLTPDATWSYDLASGEAQMIKEKEVPNYDRERYAQRRLFATAEDGTQIPITLAHRADLTPDGTNAGMLYGYGSYEVPTDPYFAPSLLSMLDRGMVYAIAHVRGGGEMGRAWYEGGKLTQKKNTFTDFIACADELISSGWVKPGRLTAEGGSAGGLLMGAVANMGGDRFCAISAVVPFVDALTTILDPSLPLTVGEWEEWGDPYHDPDVYAYMKSYSPYENVEAKHYPAILATTSLNDTRVYFVEPAKWIARLQDVASGGPFLLKTEMVAGHGGPSGRYARWRQIAVKKAFVLAAAGANTLHVGGVED